MLVRVVLYPGRGRGRGSDARVALDLLSGVTGDIPTELRPITNEYLAKANYGIGKYDDALKAIEASLAQGETGTRHYYHGLILQALGKNDLALREYDWVMTWSTVYTYPFIDDVKARVDKLKP